MPTLPPVPSVLRSRLFWDVGGSLNATSHVYWHTTSGSVSTADLTALASTIATDYDTNLGPDSPNTTILRQVEVEDLGHSTTIPGVWAGSKPGSYPTAGQSAEVATLINFVIARRYRGGKPRIYLPIGVSAQLANPRQWQSTFKSAVTAHWFNFITAVQSHAPAGASIDKQVSVSYHSGHALRPTPVIDDVLSASANLIPASQRRRMGR
jgi:hypothetical protein